MIKDGKLYGRGGADDGYATYGTMLAIKAVQEQGLPIPSTIIIKYRVYHDHRRRWIKWKWTYASLFRNIIKENWKSENILLSWQWNFGLLKILAH